MYRFGKTFITSLIVLAVFTLAAIGHADDAGPADTDLSIWPKVKSPYGLDPEIENRITKIISKMSVREKVGQIIQAEIKSISPNDIKKYHIGSVLNGGGSWPTGEANGPKLGWLAMADIFYDASMDTSDGKQGIPILWGTDAVHGHNNVVGATLFPHNIGLGAMHNPELMRDIGAVTAREVAATGIPWTFAPTVAVARDDRWGRTYESYSENPELVADYAREMVIGLQGHPALEDAFRVDKIIATAKHFIGDGGTEKGDDQGDTVLSEQILKDIHAPGHIMALGAGVQTVMATFNSWNGVKTHGNKYLLTDVLKERMGFDGLVVGDWNGHEQIPGCSVSNCAQVVNAGVDLVMVPNNWKDFYSSTLRHVRKGRISEERLNDAVRRVLRVKLRAGLFEKGQPSKQPLAGRFDLIGHAEHRAIARQAVRESLVLLKNDGVLPIKPNQHILLAGEGADNIVMQAGGWSVRWQGRENKDSDFPGATSIFSGINEYASQSGGKVTLSQDGKYEDKPDIAIVVFGEEPYAEFEGDLEQSIDYKDKQALSILTSMKQAGIPTVAVFLSGRPLWVEPEMNAADAFVAAWFPGTEGNGIADVLLSDQTGNIRHNFNGKLSFTWPGSPEQHPINVGDKDYNPAFPYGFGLQYPISEGQ